MHAFIQRSHLLSGPVAPKASDQSNPPAALQAPRPPVPAQLECSAARGDRSRRHLVADLGIARAEPEVQGTLVTGSARLPTRAEGKPADMGSLLATSFASLLVRPLLPARDWRG